MSKLLLLSGPQTTPLANGMLRAACSVLQDSMNKAVLKVTGTHDHSKDPQLPSQPEA